jgi:hypothetical protein
MGLRQILPKPQVFTDRSQIVGYTEPIHMSEKSLALIGNASAYERVKGRESSTEAFSIRLATIRPKPTGVIATTELSPSLQRLSQAGGGR